MKQGKVYRIMTSKPHLLFTVLTSKTWPKIYLGREHNYQGG